MGADFPRVLVTLQGDVREAWARTKYGHILDALKRRLPVTGVCDTTLQGLPRLLNALWVIHPDRHRWRQRFYQNMPAFRARSRKAAAFLHRHREEADVVLQIGVLFDAQWGRTPLPSVIYTDYTQALAAEKGLGRSPFTPRQKQQWQELERVAFERAHHICLRGAFVRDSVVNDYAIDAARATAVGGGLNFAELPEVPPEGDGKTILFIGKDLYRKGGDLLLQAFAGVRSQISDARLLLLTADPIPAELSVAGVEVVAPTWDRERIAELYRRSDVFVLPSRLETWGDVLLEAMAYGMPTIGVAGEAMEEIIDDEKTGLVVGAGDVEALKTAMIRLLEDTELRQRLGRAARQRVEERFTWDRVIDRIVPFLEAAAGDQRRLRI
jgi:starch synthase